MARHRSFEEKIQIIEYYLNHGDRKKTAELFDISPDTIKSWMRSYNEKGVESLKVRMRHNTYSAGFKEMIVLEYLKENIGYRTLSLKYNIHGKTTVRRRVMEYTRGKQLKSTFGDKLTMVKSRKTTYEERLKIAQYHETHNVSFRELAELFGVTYQQAYQYVKKYQASGQFGLVDRRGHRKSDNERTEVEQLKRDLEIERRKRKRAEVENAFLKKLEELERRHK
ncbi:helix-turn-helix domain-containing protein [Aliicoccus persicus]|uniref:Helix-turn-helix domain-containing protein n=1 Tax=Aliicoccus persicus TaxID=930138 RepID=A0A662Z288_9STAP|nr:helix-turn-helix domain-containing protein [Aliicoccus persicus]SEV92165.1 Helix-turn-helix domain-containing protein [Aliicoccus persicus]